MEHIKDIVTRVKPGREWSAEPQKRQRRGERVTLDTLDTSQPLVNDAVKMARAWAERKKEGYQDASVVLSGPVGTGKTHIARAILWSIYNAVDEQPIAPVGRFYPANDLIQAVSPETFTYAMIPQNCPILVIDDAGSEQAIPYIGGEYQKDEIGRRYFKIIDHCYTWQISVIMTTNLSISSLGELVGHRAWSRLSEMAPSGFMIDLTGVRDWRKMRSGRAELEY